MPRQGSGSAEKSSFYNLKRMIKETLVSLGFFEVINYTFVSTESYESTGADISRRVSDIQNPLSETQSVLKSLATALFN